MTAATLSPRFDPKPRPIPPFRPRKVALPKLTPMGTPNMTIGLVAKCWWNEHLVAISDRQLSYNDVVEAPDDATSKAYSLSKTWGALYSAGNVGPIPAIMQEVHYELYCSEGAVTEQTVRAAFRRVWWQSVNERVRDRYLAPLGIDSLDEFRRNGLAELGQTEFSRITNLIENFDPEIQFLVYGFDQDKHVKASHIFEVGKSGQEELFSNRDVQGFGVIGSGMWPALGMLVNTGAGGYRNLKEAVYRLCEAKFVAETASGVGRATTVSVMAQDGRVVVFPDADISAIRSIWEKERKQDVPYDADDILEKTLKTVD